MPTRFRRLIAVAALAVVAAVPLGCGGEPEFVDPRLGQIAPTTRAGEVRTELLTMHETAVQLEDDPAALAAHVEEMQPSIDQLATEDLGPPYDEAVNRVAELWPTLVDDDSTLDVLDQIESEIKKLPDDGTEYR